MYQSFLDSKEVYQILNGDMQVGLILAAMKSHVCISKVGVLRLPILVKTNRVKTSRNKCSLYIIQLAKFFISVLLTGVYLFVQHKEN